MPRNEQVISVFVASPDDVSDERNKIEEVISEINDTLARERGLRFELIRWESHTHPGVGVDAQDVINNQIPNDIDIFVGIMWKKFGTPTKRAGSGTVEEFERAKARFDEDNESIKIMFYFKDEAVVPSQIDIEQMAKVNDFRTRLGDEGTLYRNFTDIQVFEKIIRMHLTRQLQAFSHINSSEVSKAPQAESNTTTTEEEKEDEDLGIYELEDIVEDRFTELTDIANRIATTTTALGDKIRSQAEKLDALPRDENGYVDKILVKQNMQSSAAEMDRFSSRVLAELPLFNNAMNTGIGAFIKTIELLYDFDMGQESLRGAKSTYASVTKLRTELTKAKDAQVNFCDSIYNIPRMTVTFNKSKRKTINSIEKFINELDNGLSLLSEVDKSLLEFIDHTVGKP